MMIVELVYLCIWSICKPLVEGMTTIGNFDLRVFPLIRSVGYVCMSQCVYPYMVYATHLGRQARLPVCSSMPGHTGMWCVGQIGAYGVWYVEYAFSFHCPCSITLRPSTCM
jgi:hypothetical protein